MQNLIGRDSAFATWSVKRLVLWDIDGTLVRVGSPGSDVFADAVEHVTGMRPPNEVVMSGKTDPQIAREFLAMLSFADSSPLVPQVLKQLAIELERAEDRMRKHGRVLPGVVSLLKCLAGDSRITQTVVTGNIAPNALLKLKTFGLETWLDLEIGAFGSDQEQRRELVPIALERASRIRGLQFERADIWVVGDTPADLECARSAGVRCLLVATGRTPLLQLERLGADAAIPDLEDTEACVSLIMGSRP